MIKIKLFKDVLVQKIPLLIIIVITVTLTLSLLYQQSLISPSYLSRDLAASISAITVFESAYADHGQEITLTLHNSSFGPLTSGAGNQLGVFANYKVNDNSIVGQKINAVMEVYAANGTLIRTSSYPDGFIAQGSGGVEGLETTINDPTVQSATANVTFRNLDKTGVLSNVLRVNLDLAGEDATSATAGEGVEVEEEVPGVESEPDSSSEQGQNIPQTDQGEGETTEENEEGDADEGDEGQELPLPLFGNQ
jgi:hypothetical protein